MYRSRHDEVGRTKRKSHVCIGMLLDAVARRDADATDQLWDLVNQRLTGLARRQVFRVHRTFDEDDVVIIVFTSLCRWLVAGNHHGIQRLEHLENHLAVMTARTVVDLYRYETRHCRGGKAEFCNDTNIDRVVDSTPGPSCMVTYRDQCSQFLAILGKDSPLGQLLMARLDGHNHEELAVLFDCSVRTIERRMADIRRKYLDYFETKVRM